VITIVFPVPPPVTVTLDDVGSTDAAVSATVTPVSPPVVVVAADVPPDVETPPAMVAETPGIIGMITGDPVVVVAAVVPPVVVVPPGSAAGGAEKMVIVVPVLLLPLSVPGGVPPAWLGNCQTANVNGLRPRAKMRFLIFNMMIL
jgi:hypothetical protein